MIRFRRLAHDDERLPETLAGLHFLASAMLMLKRFIIICPKYNGPLDASRAAQFSYNCPFLNIT